jgi:hypothetical protein
MKLSSACRQAVSASAWARDLNYFWDLNYFCMMDCMWRLSNLCGQSTQKTRGFFRGRHVCMRLVLRGCAP